MIFLECIGSRASLSARLKMKSAGLAFSQDVEAPYIS